VSKNVKMLKSTKYEHTQKHAEARKRRLFNNFVTIFPAFVLFLDNFLDTKAIFFVVLSMQ
jgi:hypothetical protein